MSVHFGEVTIAKPGDLGGGEWKLERLTGITVLFGKNGSGKSRLLRAWRDSNPSLCHYVVPERVGTLTFNPNLLSDQIEGSRRKRHSEHNFSPEYRVEIITRIQAYFLARGSVPEDRLPGNPEELEKLLAALLPDFTLTIDGNSNPPYKLVRASTLQPVGDVHQLSSGEAQILSIALDVLTIGEMWEIQGAEKRLMLIDEPDAHIHPDLQVRFADFLVRVADRFGLQITIATHSTTLRP